MRQLSCLRCQEKMQFVMRESFQKGDSGAWVGNITFHLRGGFEMDVYSCPKCGKLEFFVPQQENEETPEVVCEALPADANSAIICVNHEGIPQVRCPACGLVHDFDYPKCPRCEHVYDL